nr:hypothetical protein [Pantoea sp. 201603H]
MKRISVDSVPNPIELCTDYSSTQVYSVSALTLLPVRCEPLPTHIPKSHGTIVSEGDSYLKIEFISDECFSDRTLVKPCHYENRINFLKEKQPLLGLTTLNNICVKATERHLELDFSGSICHLKALLSSVLFTPKKSSTENLSAGEYLLKKKDQHTWEAKNRNDVEDIMQFVTIKDSSDNLRLAQLGFLDQTADTATPDSDLPIPNYSRHYRLPSIHGYLIFEGRLANEDVTVRKTIGSILSRNIDLLNNASGWKRTLTSLIFEYDASISDKIVMFFKSSPLRIAYSDFYPNLSIALTLSCILTQNGITTILVQEDYYNPGIECDIRLTLTKGLIPGEWGQLASIIFCPVIRKNKNLLKTCIYTLKKKEEVSFIRNTIHEYLYPQYPFVYLGEITSMFYRRES